MRLPDFRNFDPLNKLRKEMGIDGFIEWNPNIQWKDINPEDWRNLHIQGLEVPLEEIKTQSDGTLEYRGRKVVVYIRDQISYYTHSINDSSSSGYKFHLAWCVKLGEMKRTGRYNSRYVVSRRTDGKFMVNRLMGSQVIERDRELEMKVCRYCLRRINYMESLDDRERVYREFSVKEYFAKYDTQISNLPPHTENTAPLNVYPINFNELSQKLKEFKGWICEECRRNFAEKTELLHTHHINGDKSNNTLENLRVLCKDCHSRQPGHAHMH